MAARAAKRLGPSGWSTVTPSVGVVISLMTFNFRRIIIAQTAVTAQRMAKIPAKAPAASTEIFCDR